MTRNPKRDTERSRVVRARSPSLSLTLVHRLEHGCLSRQQVDIFVRYIVQL